MFNRRVGSKSAGEQQFLRHRALRQITGRLLAVLPRSDVALPHFR
jgi:hypothetical protein